MFNVPQSQVNLFAKLFETHRVQISACDVFFQNIRLLNGRHTILTRDDYVNYYKAFTWDIELESSPIDTIIPCGDDAPEEQTESTEREPKKTKLFVTNQTVPEYERIQKRITIDELKNTLGETHPVIIALNDNKVTLEDVVDDIFIYYCLFKYIDQIERIRIQIFSNMTPAIEYVVNNIDYDDLKRYLVTNKINPDKVNKHQDLLFFAPDYQMICKFYQTNDDPFVPLFDLDNLINRLMTNICLKSDIYVILAIYLIASFACADMKAHTESPCVAYTRTVLANL